MRREEGASILGDGLNQYNRPVTNCEQVTVGIYTL